MKKVALLFAAALVLAACHCERRTTGTPCRKASCQCQNGSCRKAQPAPKPAVTQAQKAQAAKAAAEKKATAQAEQLSTVGTARRQGNVISLNFKEPIHFAHNSDKIAASSNKNLDATANILKKYPNNTVVVKGYTDSLGDPNYNVDLSQRRAQAVADALKARGVAEDKVSAVGYGAQNPVDTNRTAAGRANNRRVELQIEVK